MNEKLISIIVPVYGVEKYIGKCIQSLLDQTYSNIEIILIDDGSPDRSGEICEEFAKKDKRIRVIHQKNSGAGMARNKGLDAAVGDYIAFVDPDDYVCDNMYELLLQNLVKTNSDIAVCDFEKVYEEKKVETHLKYNNIENYTISSKEEKIRYCFLEKYVDSILLWNKLYKKEIWKEIRFPNIRAYEDEAVMYKILYETKKLVYVKAKLYFYFQRSGGSITTEKLSKKRLIRLDVLKQRMDYYLKNNDMESFLESLFVYKTDLLRVTEMIKLNESEVKMKDLNLYKGIYNKYCFTKLNKCNTSLKNKITYLWYAIMPRIYYIRYTKKNT